MSGTFVDMIPASVTYGLSVASGMLPALGIAILMNLLFDKKNVAFFFVGWVLTALMGVNTVGAAVLGTAVAYIIYQYTMQAKENAAAAQAAAGNLYDPLSDDLGGEL